MKQSLFALIILLLFSACGGEAKNKKNKIERKYLFGQIKERNYQNQLFNFQIAFNSDWEINSKHLKTKMFGGTILEAKYLNSDLEDYPLRISIEIEKVNPFEKPDLFKRAEEEREGYDFLFDDDELDFKPIRTTTIANEEYTLNEVLVIQEGDTSYVNDYIRLEKGYYLIISTSANTPSDKQMEEQLISSIKRLK